MFARLPFLWLIFGLLALSSFAQAQSQEPAPAQAAPPATTPSTSTPPPTGDRKVWTNENVSGAKGTVSVVGDKRNQKYKMGSQSGDPATAARIKKDLDKLQAQLDDVKARLQSYKEFQEGEAVSKGERDISQSYSRVPVDQQMAKLLNKKKMLEGQIGDLLDEARKKGIDPGQLR